MIQQHYYANTLEMDIDPCQLIYSGEQLKYYITKGRGYFVTDMLGNDIPCEKEEFISMLKKEGASEIAEEYFRTAI